MRNCAAQIDCRDRDALIAEHIDLTRKMARKMARRLPDSVTRDDVEAAALLGLTEAASRYDCSRQEPFMAFAAKRVRGAIFDYLRHNDLLSRRARRGAREVERLRHELETRLGRTASAAELAAEMGMSEEEFDSRYAVACEAVAVQLDDLQNELGGAGETPRDCAERRQARECLAAALARLDERQLMVLNMYYQDGLTLREIGQILGVSESRVCQIHTGALRALRAQLN